MATPPSPSSQHFAWVSAAAANEPAMEEHSAESRTSQVRELVRLVSPAAEAEEWTLVDRVTVEPSLAEALPACAKPYYSARDLPELAQNYPKLWALVGAFIGPGDQCNKLYHNLSPQARLAAIADIAESSGIDTDRAHEIRNFRASLDMATMSLAQQKEINGLLKKIHRNASKLTYDAPSKASIGAELLPLLEALHQNGEKLEKISLSFRQDKAITQFMLEPVIDKLCALQTKFPALELSLDFSGIWMWLEPLTNFSRLTSLKLLNLARCLDGFLDHKLSSILSNFSKLQSLDLSGNHLTDAELASLASLRELESLSLSGNPDITYLPCYMEGAEHPVLFPKLRHIDLRGTSIAEVGLKELSRLPVLQSLSLGSSHLTAAMGDKLVSMDSLESMVIEKPESIQRGFKLPQLLKSLTATFVRINADEISKLIATSPHLTSLDIQGDARFWDSSAYITLVGEAMRRCRNLQYLSCPGVPNTQGCVALKSTLDQFLAANREKAKAAEAAARSRPPAAAEDNRLVAEQPFLSLDALE